jgi:uncharacterized repeat protein (TIGR02543 family)
MRNEPNKTHKKGILAIVVVSVLVVFLLFGCSDMIKVLGTVELSYNSMGGSTHDPVYLERGTVCKDFATPTKSGYSFEGWFADELCSGEEVCDLEIEGGENITLYAKWSIKQYTVSYNSNGGSHVGAITGVTYNTTITAPGVPTKTGYIFAGWYKESALIHSWSFSSDTVISDAMLYAKWDGIPKLLASDGENGDYFGYSVAISGDYTIIGAYGNDDKGSSSGSAYIFHKGIDGNWDAGTKLLASDGVAGDRFGASVAISGDYAIVGASEGDDASGSAYIFHKGTAGNWDAGTKILASDGASDDYFGFSAAISGDYAIIGAYGNDDKGYNSGSVYIFHKGIDGNWDTGTKILASDGASRDFFGSSVAISGDTAIVGAFGDDTNSGSAYIFHKGTSGWDTGTKIVAADGAASDYFGLSVAISGETAIVGASYDDINGVNTGSAYIFHKETDENWDTGTKIVASDGAAVDRFGYSVAISGETAIVGAYEDDDNGWASGSAYLYHKESAGWDTGTKILASDGTDYDCFGFKVAISGETAIVGAYSDDHNGANSGSAYYYTVE